MSPVSRNYLSFGVRKCFLIGCLCQGYGVELDYVEAFGRLAYAAKAEDGQAAKNLPQLKQILGDQVSEGTKRAAEIEAIIKRESERD